MFKDKILQQIDGNTTIKHAVLVHYRVQLLMDHLCSAGVVGGNEYALYLKSEKVITPSGKSVWVIDSKDVNLPEQTVSVATVKFEEDRPDVDWNAVIHRHPEGCNEFSGTDDDSINCNFEVSLLYMRSKGIFRSHINIPLDTPLFTKRLGVRTNDIFLYAQ